MILVFLSPETLWDMFEMDLQELRQLPHLIEVADDLINNMNIDAKLLFIMNAVSRITKKNVISQSHKSYRT
jgi:hypothetical protein